MNIDEDAEWRSIPTSKTANVSYSIPMMPYVSSVTHETMVW
jgi:hypothetical protein